MPDSRNLRRFNGSFSQFPIIHRGFGNRSSLFTDFFDKDPFDDPFFTQPFESFFSPSEDVFKPFHESLWTRSFGKQRGDLETRQPSRGPVIEEIPDDPDNDSATLSKSSQEPIIEHPDDVSTPRGHGFDVLDFNTGRPHKASQSYSFSSVTYGGPHGTYYKSSTTRRTGPDGVYEEVHEEKDSRTGRETNHIVHGLGSKGHGIMRKKSSSGSDDYLETLHNLTEEEKTDFDRSWRRQAEKYFPGHSQKTGLPWKWQQSEKDDDNEAIPSKNPSKQLKWRCPWARKA